jgi:uncharacterized protein (TIGR02147 family)
MISVFEYQQYREYLRDYYLFQKMKKSGFTYSRFSKQAGIRSPNYLKVIIDGKKNLTSENIVRFAKALGLTELESDYFEALVQFNQAKSAMQRDFFNERLQRVKSRIGSGGARARLLTEYEFEAITDWRYHAIMVLTNVRGFEERPSWIRERLFGLVSEDEVVLILERLQAIKLLIRDERGRLRQSYRQIKTKPDIGRMLARAFYEGIFSRAALSMKLSTSEEREFSNSIVSLSPQQIPELKRKVRKFMKELNEWALENPKPHQVYSFGFAAFPISLPEKTRTS